MFGAQEKKERNFEVVENLLANNSILGDKFWSKLLVWLQQQKNGHRKDKSETMDNYRQGEKVSLKRI